MTLSVLNRRRHARISINADYQLVLDGVEYNGKVDNISLSGAFLIMPDPGLTPSSVHRVGDLKIKLNDNDILFKCEIVYVETSTDSVFPAGVGVTFCDNDKDTATAIWNLAIERGIIRSDFFHVADKKSS